MSKNFNFNNCVVPDSTVTIPRCEYARLIAAKAKLDMVERLMLEPDGFMHLSDAVKLLFTPPKEDKVE